MEASTWGVSLPTLVSQAISPLDASLLDASPNWGAGACNDPGERDSTIFSVRSDETVLSLATAIAENWLLSVVSPSFSHITESILFTSITAQNVKPSLCLVREKNMEDKL